MNHDFFIRRPYLAMVIAIVITFCGVISIFFLPVAQYPNVTPPQVSITANYPGADAETLLNTVVEPIETQVNGVRDMIYMSSNSANSGSANIVVTFRIGSDGQENTKNVQSRVNWALPQLPEPVQKQGVIVREQSGNILLAIALYSEKDLYSPLFLSNYASIHLVDELSRIPGIAQVQTFGASNYAMRFWLNNEKLAALNMSAEEVIAAIRQQNIQVSAGSLGAAPSPPGQQTFYTVQTKGRLTGVEEFGNIVLRSGKNGAQVRLRDVARVELGSETYNLSSRLNHEGAVLLLVYQLNDANGIEISKACREKLEELGKNFPAGMKYGVKYDSTRFIQVSIRDVVKTLLLAVALVALVVYIFLQDWRMALVPILAIPVSIVGTFAVLLMLGYSINLVTLFGLILAIGIVVDDAIIVIENVSRLMKDEGLSPGEAAAKSMAQISGAIVATSAVLLAMFLPICFLRGITGELYRQFGVTISVAVVLSAVNALSLSPALSTMILKKGERSGNFILFRGFNTFFAAFSLFYGKLVSHSFRFRIPLLVLYAVFAGIMVFWYSRMPGGFIPEEDQGAFFLFLQMPSNTPLAQTLSAADEASVLLREIPGVKDVITIAGFNVLTRNPNANNAFLIVTLDDWDERLKKKQSIETIMKESQMRLFGITRGFFMPFQPPPIPGIGTAGGFDFVLATTDGNNVAELQKYLYEMLGEAMRSPEFNNVFCAWNPTAGAVYLNIDRDKALNMGIRLESVYTVLESTLGFLYLNDFNRFGQVYKVEIQGLESERALADRIRELYVRNEKGQMTQLASFVELSHRISPESLNRYNMRLSADIQGMPAHGISSGTVMKRLEELAAKILPPDMRFDWTNMSYQEKMAGNETAIVFTLAVIFIFLFLAALYESWMLPLSVILTIPFVFPGAIFYLTQEGIDNNIYTRVGLVLLFAMACKTAILIVDFAKQQREADGVDIQTAALNGAKLRFRAILMTALAFICGTIPLAFASGPGAGSQKSIGCSVVGGMSVAILLILLMTPLFFAICQRLLEGRKNIVK